MQTARKADGDAQGFMRKYVNLLLFVLSDKHGKPK